MNNERVVGIPILAYLGLGCNRDGGILFWFPFLTGVALVSLHSGVIFKSGPALKKLSLQQMTSQLLNFSKSLTSLKNVAYRALLIKQTECISMHRNFVPLFPTTVLSWSHWKFLDAWFILPSYYNNNKKEFWRKNSETLSDKFWYYFCELDSHIFKFVLHC